MTEVCPDNSNANVITDPSLASSDTTPGTIIFGGYDKSKYSGNLVPFPLIEPSPYGDYELDIAAPAIEVVLDGKTYTVPPSSVYHTVLLDTGTAISRIPADQFAVINNILGLSVSSEEPFYTIPCAAATLSGGFDFIFSGPNGQVSLQVPWAELVVPNGNGTCILGLAPQATNIPVAILGDTVLRSAYLLYNFDAGTISIAQVNYARSAGHIISL